MGKSKLFLLLAISLLLFSLSGCGFIGDYSLSISIDPFKEIHDFGYVNVSVEGKSGLYSFHNDGDITRLNADVIFPVGIKFIGWGGRDGHLVNDYTGELLMNKSMQITAKFEVNKGVAVYKDGTWQDQMEDSISDAIGGDRSLLVFPGIYFENDILVNYPFISIYSMLGPQKTTVIGKFDVRSENFSTLKGFTLEPIGDSPSVTFAYQINDDLDLTHNIFKNGKGIIFEGKIKAPLSIEHNLFQGTEGIIFLEDVENVVSIHQNEFSGETGPLFYKDIKGFLSIKNNSFSDLGEGLSFHGVLEEEIEIENNNFQQVGAGILFTDDVLYFNDILIKNNSFRNSSIGIEFGSYDDYWEPSLKILENNFYDNNQEGAIGVHFVNLDKINEYYDDDYLNSNNDPQIRYNNFSGNYIGLGAGQDIWSTLDDDYKIDARGNWWGSKDGPSPAQDGDPVIGPIEVEPWRETPN